MQIFEGDDNVSVFSLALPPPILPGSGDMANAVEAINLEAAAAAVEVSFIVVVPLFSIGSRLVGSGRVSPRHDATHHAPVLI